MYIKLSKWCKDMGICYTTGYNMFKTGRLPVKAIQLQSGTILIENFKKIACRVKEKGGKRQFTVQIDLDLDAYDLTKEEKEDILASIEGLAYGLARKLNISLDEESVKYE